MPGGAASQLDVGLLGAFILDSDDPHTIAKLYGEGSGGSLSFAFSHSGSGEQFYLAKHTFEVEGPGEAIGELDS
jgi:hypothetical protein